MPIVTIKNYLIFSNERLKNLNNSLKYRKSKKLPDCLFVIKMYEILAYYFTTATKKLLLIIKKRQNTG